MDTASDSGSTAPMMSRGQRDVGNRGRKPWGATFA